MPSSTYFPPRSLSISQIEKCFPWKWKQNIEQIGAEYTLLYSNTSGTISKVRKIRVELMIGSFLTSLKDLIRQGNLGEAFKIFSLIQLHIASSSCYGFIVQPISSLLRACAEHNSLSQGRQLHAQIINLGLFHHPFLIPKLVTFYSTFNLLSDARVVAECSHILHPLSWNVVMSAYIGNGHCKEALDIYKQMLSLGIRPDNFTYPSVLKACGEQLDLAFGREVHRSINASNCGRCLFVQNALVSMYGKCGDVKTAREVFDKLPQRDAISWNSMVSAYASQGMWMEAFELFENMQEKRIELNIITWNIIAGGCLRTKDYKGALELLSRMRSHGIHLDTASMIIGLSACSHIGAIRLGKEIHASAIRSGHADFDNVKNALITMYSRCKDLKHAYVLFLLIEDKSIITWNSIISGYANWDKSEEASFLFREMLLSGFKPNYVTIASILPLCARVANLQHGEELHCYITRREEFKDYLLLWNSLVDMYARSGKISNAERVFDLLRNKDEVTYTSLIAGYGIQGEGEVALELFEEMIGLGIKPDHITMVAVLSACSHSGLVTKGQRLFDKMSSVYGITPCLEHFACMADLFGRAGLLKRAEEIFRLMPGQPSPAMWATLIGACHIHGNTELGEWAAGKLLEMKPKDPGYYVLIANVYAAAGCWNKLAKVRNSMRDLGVRKDPGCSWVDIGTGFQPFSAGDTSMALAYEIYILLDGLTEQMKDDGYFISEDFVIDEEAFEDLRVTVMKDDGYFISEDFVIDEEAFEDLRVTEMGP
ncbi:hypothetical protein Nepgr_001168 [Nepenthes gracilis]|uniref:Pentatricopeptide repeat-containing protein n=1 Tax=Nepenthes gracilis TaxID=150966 RepID=A0AAD3RWS4_NEPGR|nr:hypothetical protein Nepgr_001168 [Nepenthes gracilis]